MRTSLQGKLNISIFWIMDQVKKNCLECENKKKLKQFNSPLKLLLGLDISKAFSCISISSAVGCGDFLSFKMSLMENGVTDGVLEVLSVFSVNSSSILWSLQVYNRSTPLLHNIKLISHKFLERISQAYRRILPKKKKN